MYKDYIVVDIDEPDIKKKAQEMFLPLTKGLIQTPRGLHMIFDRPKKEKISIITGARYQTLGGFLVDYRTNRGYIIVPNKNTDNRVWVKELEDDFYPLPVELQRVTKRGCKITESLLAATSGVRDTKFFQQAKDMLRYGLDYDETIRILLRINSFLEEPLEEEVVHTKVASAYKNLKNTEGLEKQTTRLGFELEEGEYEVSGNKVRILPTAELLLRIIKHHQVQVKFDVFNKQYSYFIDEDGVKKNIGDPTSFQLYVYDLTIKHGIKMSTTVINKTVESFCTKEKIKENPLEEWVTTLKLDKEKDIKYFFNKYFKTKNSYYAYSLFEKWFIQAVACICKDKFTAEGILILQGQQRIGKTSFIKNLLPDKFKNYIGADKRVDIDQKDSVIEVTQYFITELGEIETTSRKEEGKLKSFITREKDEYRRPYGSSTEKHDRRTVFIGTGNQLEFLKDETGNFRWWVIEVESIHNYGQVELEDLNSLWAYAYHLYTQGVPYYFTHDLREQHTVNTRTYLQKSPLDDFLENNFGWDGIHRLIPLKEVLEICNSAGMHTTSTLLYRAMQKRGCKKRCVDGKMYYEMGRPYSALLLDNKIKDYAKRWRAVK